MPRRHKRPSPERPSRPAADSLEFRPGRVVAAYAAMAGTAIVASELAGAWIWDQGELSPATVATIGVAKGLVFVAATAAALYVLCCRMASRLAAQAQEKAAATRIDRFLRIVAEQSTEAIFIKDIEGRYLLFNREAGRTVGREALSVLGLDDRALFPEDEAAAMMAVDQRVMAEGKILSFEEMLTTPRGPRWFRVTKGPLHDERGQLAGMFGMAADITDRRAAEDSLRRSERRFRSMFENMLGGFAFHEVIRENGKPVDFRYLFTNARFESLTGLKGVVGRRASDVMPRVRETDPELYEASLRVVQTGRPERFEIHMTALDRWFVVSLFMVEENVMATIFDNISDRKSAQQKIEYLAFHDALTGLPNRLLAEDRMAQAIAHADRAGAKAALLFLDLDGFKGINDTLGHSYGDDLIRAVGKRLRDCIRETDTISRHGGDEFLIVLSGTRSSEAVGATASKILGQIGQPYDLQGREILTTGSIGIALHPDDGSDFETLLKKADTAMYHAKEEGRNTFRFFDTRMNVGNDEMLKIRNGLHLGLDRGEFELHYQPQLDLTTGRVIGAEALLRWNHPDLGPVSPGRFIPVAEETGLIVPIGEWVLRTACRAATRWQTEGLAGVTVAVNLSALQFKRGNLEQTITAILSESGLDPSLLELELTESVLIKDVESVLATVVHLKSLGLKLAIDDFGTGYSSLSYLKRFKVDKLKIDRSFIHDLASDPDDAAIIRTIIQMARSLNQRTIAEGVEDRDSLDRLRIFRCDEVQGFHIARPMPLIEFVDFVRSRNDSAADSAGGGGAGLPILPAQAPSRDATP